MGGFLGLDNGKRHANRSILNASNDYHRLSSTKVDWNRNLNWYSGRTSYGSLTNSARL